jgi:rhodanese-related sulfurtransferase
LNKNPFAASFRPLIESTVGGHEKKSRESIMSTWTAPEAELADVVEAYRSGATIIDVREPDEFAGGHVPGAVSIPLSVLGERLSDIESADVLYVICKSGKRSLRAASELIAAGHTAVSVAGGTDAWCRSGQPITES